MEPNEKIDISKRKRKVDLNKMDSDKVEALGEELGKKLGAITNEAQNKANRIASIYGFKVVVAIQFIDPITGEILSL